MYTVADVISTDVILMMCNGGLFFSRLEPKPYLCMQYILTLIYTKYTYDYKQLTGMQISEASTSE